MFSYSSWRVVNNREAFKAFFDQTSLCCIVKTFDLPSLAFAATLPGLSRNWHISESLKNFHSILFLTLFRKLTYFHHFLRKPNITHLYLACICSFIKDGSFCEDADNFVVDCFSSFLTDSFSKCALFVSTIDDFDEFVNWISFFRLSLTLLNTRK